MEESKTVTLYQRMRLDNTSTDFGFEINDFGDDVIGQSKNYEWWKTHDDYNIIHLNCNEALDD